MSSPESPCLSPHGIGWPRKGMMLGPFPLPTTPPNDRQPGIKPLDTQSHDYQLQEDNFTIPLYKDTRLRGGMICLIQSLPESTVVLKHPTRFPKTLLLEARLRAASSRLFHKPFLPGSSALDTFTGHSSLLSRELSVEDLPALG